MAWPLVVVVAQPPVTGVVGRALVMGRASRASNGTPHLLAAEAAARCMNNIKPLIIFSIVLLLLNYQMNFFYIMNSIERSQ